MKCPKCGSTDFRKKTEYYKAKCDFQYLIDDGLFCYDCQSDVIKQVLDHPVASCDDCEGTPTCPASPAAAEAVGQNYKTKKEKPDWEYGHEEEYGRDGKPTGRTVSFRRDQKTGKREETIHTRFKPDYR